MSLIAAVIVSGLLLAPMHPGHTEICYWKDRHKAHCVEGFYITKKKPTAISEVQIGKGKPCDSSGCIDEP
jgi:hypothetical protein